MALLIDAIFRRFVTQGRLDIVFPDGTRRSYGDGTGPAAGMHILTRAAERGLIVNPTLMFGEAYMDGTVKPLGCDLYTLLSVLMSNVMEGGHVAEKVASGVRYAKRKWTQLNTHRNSRRNVAHHYDLNGKLYDLFLDKDRQYSCAYFERGDESLDEAQEAKKRHIAAKLLLDRPDLEVLDIGCGWGGMALTLARDYGARVLGITLSDEQLAVARERAVAAGLEDRVRFEKLDYRDLTEKFDRIVSIGMFEHVGIGHFDVFFDKITRILADDGVMVLHSIGRNDGPGSTNPWIDRYIFPGGYSPALSETIAAIERAGLWITDCEVLRLHYARTIEIWRQRFDANRDKISKMYDERFCRMFEMYLAGAELSFRVQGHMNFQIQMTRKIDAVPFTRDYMIVNGKGVGAPEKPQKKTTTIRKKRTVKSEKSE